MCTHADAMTVEATTCADRRYVCASVYPAVAYAGARPYYRSSMAARGDAMFANPSPCTHRADMSACSHTVAVGVRADPDAKNVHS